MEASMFDRKTICIVTGASRGFGRAISVKFAKEFKIPVSFILWARSAVGLAETASAVELANPKSSVCVRSVDLGDVAVNSASLLSSCLMELGTSPSDYEQAIIVHNVGSLNDITKLGKDFSDPVEMSKYFNINVSNPFTLNAQFLHLFPPEKTKYRLVLNISSILAIFPMKTFSLYCSGKAARDMYFKVVAAEESDNQTLVLNYAPGPLNTDMGDIAKSQSSDPGVHEMYRGLEKDGKILDPEVSVDKLIEILNAGKFKSGDHVDVFDDI